jgi:hypothetical protein
MNKQCPKCGKWTVKFDDYFYRDRCMMRRCSWVKPLKETNNKVWKNK